MLTFFSKYSDMRGCISRRHIFLLIFVNPVMTPQTFFLEKYFNFEIVKKELLFVDLFFFCLKIVS